MVTLISSYLFDHPEYMYSPREAPTDRSWTVSPVPGNRLADSRVYFDLGPHDFGGGAILLRLEMLRRATIVGERTAGSAHAGVWHRIDDHFGMGIPETKTINPFAVADWERQEWSRT